MIERIKSGIPGLDKIVGGGIPKDSLVLVSGECGTGKTLLASQFIYMGAFKYNEPGVYITLEENPARMEYLYKEMFNWDLKALERKKKLILTQIPLFKFKALKESVISLIESINAKRLVIDTLTNLGLFFETPVQVRRAIVELNELAKEYDVTAIVTTEIPEGRVGISVYGVEEFVCDGVLVLSYIPKYGKFRRGIRVRKMRGTKHSERIHPVEITKKGLIVKYNEEIRI